MSEKADGVSEEPGLDQGNQDEDGGQAVTSSEAKGESGGVVGSGSAGEDEGKAAPGWYPDPNSPNQQKYWDGATWSDKVMPAGAPVSTIRRSADERKAMLAQQVQQAVGRGLRIESQSDFQAVLIDGKPVNHTLHAILTIFTCLLWGVVWAVIAGTGGEKREMIVADEFGNIQHQKLGRV